MFRSAKTVSTTFSTETFVAIACLAKRRAGTTRASRSILVFDCDWPSSFYVDEEPLQVRFSLYYLKMKLITCHSYETSI